MPRSGIPELGLRATVVAALCVPMVLPNAALGYASGSSVTKDCHEQITLFALDSSEWPRGTTPPESENAERLAGQLAVPIPSAHENLWSVSTVIGVRWPDFEGAEPSDFVALNRVHTDVADQREHCLRAPSMDDTPDDPAGSREAVAACRAYIREQMEQAIGAEDRLDLEATETVELWLAFVGDDEVEVQRFGFHMGQALHALQDSFSHTVRTEDGRRIRHVLNYAESVGGTLDEDVDGHEHRSALDDCELGTPLLDARVSQATQASTALLQAVASAEGGRRGRLERVDAVLDEWLTFAEDDECVLDIDACNPPELAQSASGCTAGGRAGGGALVLMLGVLGCLAFRRNSIGLAGLLAFASVLVASAASAQDGVPGEEAMPPASEIPDEEREADATIDASGDEELAEEAQEQEQEGAVVVGADPSKDELSVVEERQVEADSGGMAINDGVGFQLSVFGSLDEAGFGGSLGLRFPIGEHFILGVDGEYDSWLSTEAGRLENGAFNGYLTGIIVWAIFDRVEIRSNIHAGVTVLLSDLYNADRGSVGPFFGVTPISAAVRVTRAVRVVLDPGGIFVEMPRIDPGPPLLRRSHRLMVGIHITP